MSKSGFLELAAVGAASALAIFLAVHSPAADAQPRAAGSRAGPAVAQRAHGALRRGESWSRTTTHRRTDNGRASHDEWRHEDGRRVTRDVAVANDREAGTRTRSVEWVGPQGRTRSVDSVTTRSDDGFTRSTTVTNARGETATGELTVVHDREAGTRSVDIERTGFDGRSSSVHGESQRTAEGFTRETTVTLPSGTTRTRSVKVSCDRSERSCTRKVEVNGGAGS